jgi:hypothetical protein
MSHPQRIATTLTIARAVMVHGAAPAHRLMSAGLTRHQLTAAVKAEALVPIRFGVLLDVEQWRYADEIARLKTAVAAAHAARPGGVAMGATAALLLDIPTFDARGDGCSSGKGNGLGDREVLGHQIPQVHFALRNHGENSGWLKFHKQEIPSHQRIELNGLPVTALARTAIDYSLTLRIEQAVAVLDACIRRVVGAMDTDRDIRRAVLDTKSVASALAALQIAAMGSEWRDGAAVLRKALTLINPASESVLESMSRVNMKRGRLPEPECGQPVRGADGYLYWCDFLWRRQRVIGEADGMSKYLSLDDLRREKIRQEALANAGWTVIRWNWDEGVVNPKVMRARIRKALARAAA